MKSRLIIGSIVLLWGVVCLASMLHATGGALSMPLDDAFIFFQYGQRLAAGAPFSYQDGDAATTGATSLLTVAVDAVGWAVGFRGERMVVFALLVGAVCLGWAALSALTLGRRLCPRLAWAPPALILASGPLVWGAFSGMDLPLFAALALAFAARWPEGESPPPRSFFVLGALLGLARPDAVFLIAPALLLTLRRGRSLWWLLPLGGAAFPFAAQLLITGSPQSASMDVKSVLGHPGLSRTDWIVQAVDHLVFVIKGVFGGAAIGDPLEMAANNRSGSPLFLAPFALPLVLLGLMPGAWLEIRRRAPGLHLLLLVWVALLTTAQAFTVPSNWHWNRYLMSIYVLALPGIAIGIDRAGRWIELAWSELAAGDGGRVLAGTVLLLSLPGLAFFFVAYGRNCADIRFQHIELAHRLNALDGVGETTVVGVHDVGALTYFGDYRVLDLEGLATREFQKASRLRSAGVWETLERLEPARRPDYLAVYASWFDPGFLALHRPLFTQRQFAPSIAAGNPLAVYATDWSRAGSGSIPPDIPETASCELVAEIDVADLVSEASADYAFQVLDGAYDNLFGRMGSGEREAVDGGRIISGGETFRVAGYRPGNRITLVLRSHSPFRLRVEADGEPVGVWSSPRTETGRWTEGSFTFRPTGNGTTPRIMIRSDDPHHSAYGSFHYWVYQCP